MTKVLITGGAGFIGCHVAKRLLQKGYTVRVFDALIDQVHGGQLPPGLPADVELIRGDVRDQGHLRTALRDVDKVVHLAAEVGVGQSMYAVDRYVSVNDSGTANLMQCLIEKPVERLVTASSMSVYGEGLYRNVDGEVEDGIERIAEVGGGRSWDPTDAKSRGLIPVATPEWKRTNLASVYALTKYVQEKLTLNVCRAYAMDGVALRLFNVYGPGQALSNPYTGVLAIFASRILNGNAPLLFEDGMQRRDFVHVDDIAAAFILALEEPKAKGEIFNIGSGHERTILDIARTFIGAMNRPDLEPEVLNKARTGDIRHCFADITKARTILGFEPRRDFGEGLAELAAFVASQQAHDHAAAARKELEARGLFA